MYWVKWEVIVADKKNCDLDIGSLGAFNLALLQTCGGDSLRMISSYGLKLLVSYIVRMVVLILSRILALVYAVVL